MENVQKGERKKKLVNSMWIKSCEELWRVVPETEENLEKAEVQRKSV